MGSNLSRDVVMKLGEPSDKLGGNRSQAVQISYELLGIDIHFKFCDWDNAENPMGSIAIFPQVDQAFDMCVRCGKQAKFHCGRCRLRRYCSSTCQKADWCQHQKECM